MPTTSRNNTLIRQNVFVNPRQSTTFRPRLRETSAVRIRSLPVDLLSDFAETFQRFTASDGGRLLSLPRHFSSNMHIQVQPLDSSTLPAPVHTWFPSLVFLRFSHRSIPNHPCIKMILWGSPAMGGGSSFKWLSRVFVHLRTLEEITLLLEKKKGDGGDTFWLVSQLEQTAPSYLAKWGIQVFFPVRFASMFLLVKFLGSTYKRR